jgi:hypothetical protein
MALINLIPTVKLVDCSAGRRLQRNQRDSRDPAGACDEEARRSPAGTRPPGT